MTQEALKLALEALEEADEIEFWNKQKQAIIAIKEALAQPEQEPLLLIQSHRDGYWCDDFTCKKCYAADFRFKHTPPQPKWPDY